MDFISGLPKSKEYELIWVIMDKYSRSVHFLPLSHPISAKTLAKMYLGNIYKLHGLPIFIVSDRDPIFLSDFWQERFKLVGQCYILAPLFTLKQMEVLKGLINA